MRIVEDTRHLLEASPDMAKMIGLKPFADFPELMGNLFTGLCANAQLGTTVSRIFADNPTLVDLTLYDITETARRNFEPGGVAATLLFSRGVQAVIAHRVAHQLWVDGGVNLALAVKTICGRSFSTDMHPAAKIGAGLWLDHGLGFVLGETSVIEEDVSIWHNVTLGSTLSDSGPRRHPYVGRGAVIGAGAILLGGITIGQGANVAAGAIVVEDVAEGALIVGTKAKVRGTARISFDKETQE